LRLPQRCLRCSQSSYLALAYPTIPLGMSDFAGLLRLFLAQHAIVLAVYLTFLNICV
jgi:hypothetical protein